ncbi:MAG: phenylalanine--tRNA ligase subunit beta [Gammaproteobacteria bacterium]|nr:phenylalanine--tRNA ligase subunit beta [Gammaproteobacteria bacterium]MCI0591616.1 phenylalanine--tRNA ligase subunit beta [Gammaproteobacteria bacterium]
MQFSEQWLREWVDPPVPTETLVEQLTMAGLEVESVQPAAPEFRGVVVAEIVNVDTGGAAEQLQVCQVRFAKRKPSTVVCGASNVRAGMRAPLAVVGAVLPGGRRLAVTTVRGITSEGRLCSPAELGLGDDRERLMELPADAPPGKDLREFLALDDKIIELAITPNRGDCLSIAGVAREVGVLTACKVQGPAYKGVQDVIKRAHPVEIDAPDACPRYVGRVIRGVNMVAPTPIWMRERLRRSGLRSINAIVDVTNYVMLEVGQPMHAFDLNKLDGAIHVRYANDGERLQTLDGQELALSGDTLAIADERRVLALAGIIGGLDSAVSETTRDVFLESAFFTPRLLAGRARRYGLHTDSSHRFERGVDFELQRRAVDRATALILEICGGEAGPIVDHCFQRNLPRRRPITLRARSVERLVGVSMPDEAISDILAKLRMQVEGDGGVFEVTPPSFRFDVEIEADLIEELVRVRGYHTIPSRVPQGRLKILGCQASRVPLSRVRQVMVDRGYQEVITYSFVDPILQARLAPNARAIPLTNPLASDMSVMRTSLWPGLVQTLIHNRNRQQARVRLFECGLVFRGGTPLEQENMLGGAITGTPYTEQWGMPAVHADFYDLKGDVEALLRLASDLDSVEFRSAEHPALHPGQAAGIYRKDRRVGLIGSLHPAIAQALDLRQTVLVFELQLCAITEGQLPRFTLPSKFPSVRRDLAVMVDQAVPAADVLDFVAKSATDVLKNLQLFDVYEGEGIDPGKKSLAMGLTFQGSSSTLIDEEVDALVEGILAGLKKQFGITLRQ